MRRRTDGTGEVSFWAQLLQLLHPSRASRVSGWLQQRTPQPGCRPAGLPWAGESSLTFFCDLLLCPHLFSAFHFKTMIFLGFKWDFCSESPLKYPVVCKHTRALLEEGIPVFNSATDTPMRCWAICTSKCPGTSLQDVRARVCLFTNANADFDTQVLRDLRRYL